MGKEKKLKGVKHLTLPNCEGSFMKAAELGYEFAGYSEYARDGFPRVVEFVKYEHQEGVSQCT
jgi:hypothetical protein